MTKNSRLHEQGFTIVEMLVAIMVSSIIIGALTTVTINNSHLSQRGRDATLANAFAEAKVEALRSAGYSALADGTTNVTTELPAELKNPRSGYLIISSPEAGMKRAQLDITYNDQGQSRTYSYTTLIGELGVGQN